jgi:hypothetical protein
MIQKFTLFAILLIFSIPTNAQEKPFYESYDWQNEPTFNTNAYAEEDLVELKSKILTEFYFINEGKNLIEYYLFHRALFLNSDNTIEDYNKIYLPYNNSSKLIINKARVITPSKKVITLDESNIYTAEDEETGSSYKYFALEGVEKGSVVEYYYVIQKYPDYKGRRITFQEAHPVENVEFDLYAPSNLVFNFKSYNNFPEVVLDTLSKEKLHWEAATGELPELEPEETSAYHANKAHVVYKLDKNLADNSSGISSYDVVSKNIYKRFYTELSRRDEKALDKFLKNIKVEDNEAATLRNLDYYIKTNFYLSEGINEDLYNLQSLLDEKVANDSGIMLLYINALKKLDIKHELVITSDRFEIAFDPDFEASNFLREYLLYFPSSQLYVAPTLFQSRLGYPPAGYTDNYGLFIKEIKVGSYTSGAGKIKYINPVPAEKSYDKMTIDVNFEKDNMAKPQVKLQKSMFGYYASYIQPYINLMSNEDKDDLKNSLAESIQEGLTINKSEIINGDPMLFGKKPLIFSFEFTSDKLVEKAGKRYLFKVGELIGRQTELYQEKERKLPLDSEFKREYFRTITVKIPEGYQIANLEDINLDESYAEDGKSLMAFKSSYELKDNTLTIIADEYYKENHLPVEKFKNYRRVINSAADFNKVVLVLEQKS